MEGVDAKDATGNRSGNLPTEKFCPQVINVGHRNSQHGMPGLFERRYLRILRHICRVFRMDIGKHAIVAVSFRRRQLFAVDGDDAFSKLPRRLGHQLLKPGAEVRDVWRRDDREFIPAIPSRRA